ncbi:MAG: hypothetical protein JW384_00115 [Nitrosomonadaceae bacterium]|nr:hypothetical protein [Nitrosomonadaceae bacterium]
MFHRHPFAQNPGGGTPQASANYLLFLRAMGAYVERFELGLLVALH